MEDVTYTKIFEHETENWWYRVRRTLAMHLLRTYAPASHPKVLDIGCGTGLLLKELSAVADAYGVDMSPVAVDFCHQRGLSNVMQTDGVSLPFPDATFDAVFALDVIEHIDDDTAAVREMKRVLKPGGVAIIFVPAFMSLWGKNDELGQHRRRYRLPRIVSLFTDAGYQTLRASYFNFFLFLPILVVRRIIAPLVSRQGSELEQSGAVTNAILHRIFDAEFSLLKHVNLPFGVSAFLVAKK